MSTAADPALAAPPGTGPIARAGVPPGALGMALFLATEAMFFAGLISAFLVLQSKAAVWPPAGQPRLPVVVTGINTGVLLLSGYTMLRAIRSRRSDGAVPRGLLAATASLGALFLGIQGYEWARLVGFGLTATATTYGGTFYTLVGAHGIHVLGALVALLVVATRVGRGSDAPSDRLRIALCGSYWLFVVALWPIVYLLVYQPWAG